MLRRYKRSDAAAAADCGLARIVGRVDVYLNAPGAVVRCPACDHVLMRVVKGGGRMWVDLRGTRCLEFAVAAEG